MDKRYQVFISSTFWDLKEERQAVLKAILQLGHMPAGMELFPASDDEAWELITDVIDTSDYYVLIVGGRYGSSDAAGIGYTEKEYDYAVETGKPVIALLHENPGDLPRDKTETEFEAWEKLEKFRGKVEGKHLCKYWTSTERLEVAVVLSLTSEVHRHPAIGWVRADQVIGGEDKLRLEKSLVEAELEIQTLKSQTKDSILDTIENLRAETMTLEHHRADLLQLFLELAPCLISVTIKTPQMVESVLKALNLTRQELEMRGRRRSSGKNDSQVAYELDMQIQDFTSRILDELILHDVVETVIGDPHDKARAYLLTAKGKRVVIHMRGDGHDSDDNQDQ